MPRFLLRLSFDGSRFQGSQRNPDRDTVDGVLLATLEKTRVFPPTGPYLRPVGRTDAGVSALDYPVAFESVFGLRETALALAGAGVGLVPWAGASVAAGYDPRRAAHSRTYRYYSPWAPGLELELVREAWALFQGRHEFSRFAKLEGDKDPVRTVLATTLAAEKGFVVFEVTGESFLWNQVRRMVGAALDAGTGRLTVEQIGAALKGEPLPWHSKAPAEGLVLARVDLPLECEPLPEARELGLASLRDARAALGQRMRVLGELERGQQA